MPDEFSTSCSLNSFLDALKTIQGIINKCPHKDTDPCLREINVLLSDQNNGLINLIAKFNSNLQSQESLIDSSADYIKSPRYQFDLAIQAWIRRFQRK